jgi:hypothetical protein
MMMAGDRTAKTHTSCIENSIEAGFLLGGNEDCKDNCIHAPQVEGKDDGDGEDDSDQVQRNTEFDVVHEAVLPLQGWVQHYVCIA